MRRQAGFPGAGRSGHQNAAAAKVAFAAEHRVQRGNARGDPLVGRGMLQVHRGHRQHGNAVVLNQEGILVGPVRRAAVLDDAQTPRQNRFGDLVVEQDDAVRNVLFQAVAGQGALPAFAGDDGGELSFLEPSEQAPQFGAQNRFIFEPGEQSLDAVEEHPFGSDRIHGMTEPDEQRLQVVLAGLLDQAPFEIDVIDGQLLLRDQGGQVEPERGHIAGEFLGGFFKRDADARLAEFRCSADQEFHAEQRLAATGAAADQSGPSSRKTAQRDLIESVNSGRAFWEAGGKDFRLLSLMSLRIWRSHVAFLPLSNQDPAALEQGNKTTVQEISEEERPALAFPPDTSTRGRFHS